MTKPKKIGIVLLTAGAVLVIAALLLFSHNRAEDRRAGESAEETLRLVEAAMAERETNGETGTTPAPGDGEPDAAAPAPNAPGAAASPGAAAAGTETGGNTALVNTYVPDNGDVDATTYATDSKTGVAFAIVAHGWPDLYLGQRDQRHRRQR